MNIHFETPERLKIDLSATDLKELGTSYSELDYASADTRKLLDDLLDRIGAKEDFRLTDRRLVIEILPAERGGCTIFLTLVTPSFKGRRPDFNVGVWQFDSADALVDGIKALAPHCKNKTSLYLLEGKYRLIILGERQRALRLILSEYGHKIGGKSLALFTAEHGKLLGENVTATFSPHKPL